MRRSGVDQRGRRAGLIVGHRHCGDFGLDGGAVMSYLRRSQRLHKKVVGWSLWMKDVVRVTERT